MRKPLIGILPLWDNENKNYYMRTFYMSIIEKCGGIGVMLPLCSDPFILSQLAQSFDGFLFTGGPDVHPSYFYEEVKPYCGYICEQRDTMETMLLPMVMQLNKPIFGICRGIQLINIVLGGSLYQDIPQEIISSIPHYQEKPYDRYTHEVNVVKDSYLYTLVGKDKLSVNSMHHQCIKTLSPYLEVLATSEDGIIEAVKHNSYPYLIGVQWHPEFLYSFDEDSITLFTSFIDACKNNL